MKAEITQRNFIEKAKMMINEKGIEAISVRKIAKHAGYAHKSLYNHFGSLDGLLWHVRKIIIDDISTYLDKNMPKEIDSIQRVKGIFRNYISYFIDHPNYYRFLFFHKLDINCKSIKNATEDDHHMDSMLSIFDYLQKDLGYNQSEVMIIIQSLINISQGLLTTYISGNDDLTSDMLYKQFDDSLAFILRR